MTPYLLRRCLLAGATVVAATFLTFLLLRLAPGEPAQTILARIFLRDLTASVSPGDAAALAERYGLSAPLLVQYGRWLVAALGGDLGVSIRSGRPVLTELGWRLPVTLLLALLAMALALVLTLALVTARRMLRRPLADRGFALIVTACVSLPGFVLGLVLILVFSLSLDWLPVSGTGGWSHWVLPVTVLALGQLGFTAVLLDDALEEALAAAHIVSARARGLSERCLLLVHALPNALVPLVPYLALQFAFLVGGVVVVERLFALPGLGSYLAEALDARDGPAFLGAVAVVALAVALANLAADLIVAALDPRIRLARSEA